MRGDISQERAGVEPVLMTVVNAVAVAPTCTDRLLGRTADNKALGVSCVFNEPRPLVAR